MFSFYCMAFEYKKSLQLHSILSVHQYYFVLLTFRSSILILNGFWCYFFFPFAFVCAYLNQPTRPCCNVGVESLTHKKRFFFFKDYYFSDKEYEFRYRFSKLNCGCFFPKVGCFRFHCWRKKDFLETGDIDDIAGLIWSIYYLK